MNVLVFGLFKLMNSLIFFYNEQKKISLYDLHAYGYVLAKEPLPHSIW